MATYTIAGKKVTAEDFYQTCTHQGKINYLVFLFLSPTDESKLSFQANVESMIDRTHRPSGVDMNSKGKKLHHIATIKSGDNIVNKLSEGFKELEEIKKSRVYSKIVEEFSKKASEESPLNNKNNEAEWKIDTQGQPTKDSSSKNINDCWRLDGITGYIIPKPFEYKGVKHSEDKLPLDTVITRQFPKALEAICKATQFGHKKYILTDHYYDNFKKVKGGSQTYAEALQRHNLNKNEADPESGLPHIFHKAWNALAELELWIEENNSKNTCENK